MTPFVSSPRQQPIFLNYNLTLRSFVTYEYHYHRQWMERVEEVRGGLKAPLLVRDPDTDEGESDGRLCRSLCVSCFPPTI